MHIPCQDSIYLDDISSLRLGEFQEFASCWILSAAIWCVEMVNHVTVKKTVLKTMNYRYFCV